MSNPKLLFDNRFADGVLTAFPAATVGFDAANLADKRPYTFFKPSDFYNVNTPYFYVKVDCGTVKSADSVALCAHDLFSKGCYLTVYGSADDFATAGVLAATVTPTSDGPLISTFSTASYRYWKIQVWRINRFSGYESLFDDAYWTKSNATITANTAVAPDGTTTSDTITDASGAALGKITKVISGIDTSKTWKASINVLKDAVPAATRFCMLNMYFYTGLSEGYQVRLDTSTGAISHGGSAVAGDVAVVDNGTHWLISVTKKPVDPANVLVSFEFYPAYSYGALTVGSFGGTTGSCGIWNARLEIADMPSIGIAMIGNALTLPEPVENEFDPLGVQLHGSIDVSKNGNPLGRYIDYQQWEQSLTFNDTPLSWLRANWLTNWRAMRDQPMLFAWDVDNAPDDVYLVNIGDSFRAPVRSGGRCRLQFSLSGVSNV